MKRVIKSLTANNIKEVITTEKLDYVARIVKSALHLLDFIKSDMEVLDKLHRFGGGCRQQ